MGKGGIAPGKKIEKNGNCAMLYFSTTFNPSTDPELHNVQCYRQTDRQTDGQTTV